MVLIRDYTNCILLPVCYVTIVKNFWGAQQPHWGLGRLNVKVSRSHAVKLHSVGILWTRDRPVAATSS